MELVRDCLKRSLEQETDVRWIATFLMGPAELAMSHGDARRSAILLGAIKALLPRLLCQSSD
jgi:hypothetical protein